MNEIETALGVLEETAVQNEPNNPGRVSFVLIWGAGKGGFLAALGDGHGRMIPGTTLYNPRDTVEEAVTDVVYGTLQEYYKQKGIA